MYTPELAAGFRGCREPYVRLCRGPHAVETLISTRFVIANLKLVTIILLRVSAC